MSLVERVRDFMLQLAKRPGISADQRSIIWQDLPLIKDYSFLFRIQLNVFVGSYILSSSSDLQRHGQAQRKHIVDTLTYYLGASPYREGKEFSHLSPYYHINLLSGMDEQEEVLSWFFSIGRRVEREFYRKFASEFQYNHLTIEDFYNVSNIFKDHPVTRRQLLRYPRKRIVSSWRELSEEGLYENPSERELEFGSAYVDTWPMEHVDYYYIFGDVVVYEKHHWFNVIMGWPVITVPMFTGSFDRWLEGGEEYIYDGITSAYEQYIDRVGLQEDPLLLQEDFEF